MISADVNGRYAALWLNADCASPDCGVNIKWWKAVLTLVPSVRHCFIFLTVVVVVVDVVVVVVPDGTYIIIYLPVFIANIQVCKL